MSKQRSSVISILDIGTSKIVCFIAKVTNHGNIEILGIGHNLSSGIRAGRITDIKAAEFAIAQAVESAEKMAGLRIKKVFVGISSNNMLSQRVSSELIVTGHEINDKDLNRLLFQILDKYSEQDLEVIHTFAYEYMLDGNRGIENPLGMYGNHLTGEFHILSTPSNYVMNTTKCLANCQLEVDNLISNAYTSGLSCLTADEMSLGVTLIEFGGGATTVSVFHRGHLLFTDAVPIGGMHVTSDIAKGISTDFSNAERVKNLYGTVMMTSLDYDEVIEVITPSVTGDDPEIQNIHRSMLVEIIRARIEEILEIVKQKLDASGMARFGGNKIVITGGGSQLNGLKEIVGHIFSKGVRIGYPRKLTGLAESTSGVAFASAVGMLLHVVEMETSYTYVSRKPANDSGPLGNMLQWLKDNFG